MNTATGGAFQGTDSPGIVSRLALPLRRRSHSATRLRQPIWTLRARRRIQRIAAKSGIVAFGY
jgi:hypothetical protein